MLAAPLLLGFLLLALELRPRGEAAEGPAAAAAAAAAAAGAGGERSSRPAPSVAPEPDGCPVCVWRQHSRELRLESIKSQILSKLRLKEAPNISREVVKQLLPKAPPLQQILDLHDFQGDALQPEDFLEEDEYHATTETVISMAQESKWEAGHERWGAGSHSGSRKVSGSRSEAGSSRLLRPGSLFCENLMDWGAGAAPQVFRAVEMGCGVVCTPRSRR